MENYKNLGKNSEVIAYEIGGTFIKVQFSNGSIYLYTYLKPGKIKVEQMKVLAVNGMWLNSFIKLSVKNKYAAKLQ
jgi:hypothetical protein